MEFKEKYKKIYEVAQYMSKEKFVLLCLANAISKDEITKYYAALMKGTWNFIREVPESFLDIFISFQANIDISFRNFSFQENLWRKVFYRCNEHDEYETLEVNLLTYDGAKTMAYIYEKAETVISLMLCDEILKPQADPFDEKTKQEYVKIYEHDIIQVRDDWHNELFLLIACAEKNAIGRNSYYKQLIYTEKYGYLSPEGKPFYDKGKIAITESLFNVKEATNNYHKITLAKNYAVVGNVALNYNLLEPNVIKRNGTEN